MRAVCLLALLSLAACAMPLPFGAWSDRPQERERVPEPTSPAPLPNQGPPPGYESEEPAGYDALTFGIGAAFWDELGSLSTAGTGWRPEQFGEFDRFGFSIDVGVDAVVGRIGDLPWSLGLQFGLASFANDGDGVSRFSDRLDATWIHVAPAARLQVPLADGVTFVPGVGIGAYYLSIDEYDRDAWGYTYASRTLHDEWALGGFVDLGFDFDILDSGAALRIDNEFHWVDFDRIDNLLPAERSVGGLIYVVQLGVAVRF